MILNLILIPRFGLLGAASATVVTDVVRLVVSLVLSRRAGVRQDHVSRLLRPTVAVTAMIIAVWLARGQPVLATVALGALTYAAALGALGVLRVGPGFRVRLAA